jgi:CRP-like cAMP-binding protein
MLATNSPNHFLASLLAQDRDLLQPHLKPLHLSQGTAIYRADDTIPYVYFPHSGIGCQSASKFDPRSASNFDPLERRVRAVALAPSELVGVAETARARVVG